MIRPATVEDAVVIAQIHVRTWQAAYAGIVPAEYLAALSEEKRAVYWRKHLSQNQEIVLVADEGDAVAGWASGGLSRDSDAADASEVYALYVSAHSWRRGVGRRLMEEMEKALLAKGDILLWVLRQNAAAIGFYEQLGYRCDGAEKFCNLGGYKLPEIRLRKPRLGR
jgi:ribosomal protein S18 acetylase RimI-like enzyme